MRVRKFDNPLRFLVTSESRREVEHLCDFTDLARFPFGRCSCEDFQIRVESYMLKTPPEEPEKKQCKHLEACVRHMKRANHKAAKAQ